MEPSALQVSANDGGTKVSRTARGEKRGVQDESIASTDWQVMK